VTIASEFSATVSVVEVLLSANLGVMIFCTGIVAPAVFQVLPEQWAAAYVRAFFPRYFAFLCASSGLATLFAEDVLRRSALALCAVLASVSVWYLIPRINAARDAGQHARFRALHGVSVGINLLLLAAFGALLWLGA
jgi:hypothetical protein